MRKKITEQSVLFIGVFKWFVLATIIGSIVGFSTAIFLKILDWSVGVGHRFEYFYFFMPLAFLVSALAVKYLARDAEGHGTEKVIEAVHERSGRINLLVVPIKLVTTVLTIATGGSAGKEGPCAQIGAGLSSSFADLLRLSDVDRRKIVICGISAGFAAVFGTPIAGAIFGVEVLFVGSILYEVLLPSFIAGITAFQVTSALDIQYFHHPLIFSSVISEGFLVKVALSGVFFGLCSFMLIEMLKYVERFAKKIKTGVIAKAFLGGSILIFLTLIFSKTYLGLGLDTIQGLLRGESIPWYSFIIKSIFTTVTLGFGGSGGIVTPIFFIGASAGTLFAQMFNLDLATFAAIGMVSVLAGAANTPIAASILAIEFFGPSIAPYATVACVVSFLMTGHRSVYPSQVLSISKSTYIKIKKGKSMEGDNVESLISNPKILKIIYSIAGKVESVKNIMKAKWNNRNKKQK